MIKIKFLAIKIFLFKFNFARIISVRSTPLREKGRIRIQTSDLRMRIRIRTSDLRIRIPEGQKITDPEY
jgi:hypothetical protein